MDGEEEVISSLDADIVPTNRLAAQTTRDLQSELDRFRNEWQQELLSNERPATEQNKTQESNKSKGVERGQLRPPRHPLSNSNQSGDDNSDLDYQQPETLEEKAKYLFDKAVQLEQQGRHYDAIKFYRLSMQLDADIEFKMAGVKKKPQATPTTSQVDKAAKKLSEINLDETEADNQEENNQDDELDENRPLYERFQRFLASQELICERNVSQKSSHFSQLPVEVIIAILKWVVSENLDMRSLEAFASVCKGFYVCARDPEIWRLACAKIWGANNINNYLSTYYDDWREMYLKRPRLNFDGVYISKASYARSGEQSLDNFYRPWHVVEYYRYLRFYSNGTVLFLTSPDEPKNIVSKLNVKNNAQQTNTTGNVATNLPSFVMNEHSILRGTWTLALNKVSIVLIKKILKSSLGHGIRRAGGRQNKEPVLEQEHVFRMELNLAGKMNNQLHWASYEIDVINKLTNVKNVTNFDLNKIDFPNFFFSRVKSYSNQCDRPLK